VGLALLGVVLLAPLLLAWRVASGVLALPEAGRTRSEDPKDVYGFDYQPLSFATSDGVTLGGWLVPTPKPARGAVVFVHGHGGSRRSFLESVPALRSAGYCTVLYDTRGHPGSESVGLGDGFRDGYLRTGHAD
jgi:pimeloyl-ACP methyl ester carboxylesterase